MKEERKKYLTVHGHFYQPPRENPWLESIELQDSALPFHDWNERISFECYDPNSASRIVDCHNRIINVVNNYSLMSFNMGPTLLSWMEKYDVKAYERILKADTQSMQRFSGHGSAIAQVYNHMIMPLANLKDKYTQTLWGIRDFKYRFGRHPEGIWLAETAVDDETLEVLVDCGIKFTILSPYQAAKTRPMTTKKGEEEAKFEDVSWGNVDPARPYRYYIKNNPEKYIDLFFYDGSISKSVAFDNLLKDGNRFIKRIADGVSPNRDYDQLVNIGTDGESYGHHTKFGDMALSYILEIKAEEAGFILTNYAEYLEKYPSTYEVEIKQASSWSCFHGVERWRSDCGCSTGAQHGWNQKWRKPLRNALDYLRDELIVLFEQEGPKYFKDPWMARNNYIDVILDRNDFTINQFFEDEQVQILSPQERVAAIKLLEMQRQAMLMYTSCGWFFADISGIETTQILKYAAKSMELAAEFSEINYEEKFIEILAEAQSNLEEHGSGKNIYEKYVKPASINMRQIVAQWAICSLFEDYKDEEEIYCYNIQKVDYKKVQNGNNDIVVGRIKVSSKITLENHDMTFALLQFSGGEFHCAIKEFTSNAAYNKMKAEIIDKYAHTPLTEVIRSLDEHFGKDYYTLEDLFIEERRKTLRVLLQDKIDKFSSTYHSLYEEGKGPVMQLNELGLPIPLEFKIVAEYTLNNRFEEVIKESDDILDSHTISKASDIANEAKSIGIKLKTKRAAKEFANLLEHNSQKLISNFDLDQAEHILTILDVIKNLNIELNLREAQNIYYNCIYPKIEDIIENLDKSKSYEFDKKFISTLLNIGERLNISVEHSNEKVAKNSVG